MILGGLNAASVIAPQLMYTIGSGGGCYLLTVIFLSFLE